MKKTVTAAVITLALLISISAYFLNKKDEIPTQSADTSSGMIESTADISDSYAAGDSSDFAESLPADEVSSAESSTVSDSSNGAASSSSQTDDSSSQAEQEVQKGILDSPEDIGFHDVDGANTNFEFTYDGMVFEAIYTYDNWKIVDSYRITNKADMELICQALIDVNPVHGKDRESYRNAKDMAYEWLQHNAAYEILSDDSPWKQNAKDVDLDPDDQGKSLLDFYFDRTGR